MTVVVACLQVLLSLLVPVAVLWLEDRSRLVRVLSPVVVCYGIGMLFGNQPWVAFSDPVALTTCNATVALAIPLLLFSTDIVAWLRLARSTVISFCFCMLAVLVAGALAHALFRDSLPGSAEMAGMLAGVYTGGTPNMAAIGTALQVQPQTFILLNAADMLVSFAYLLFILVLAPRLLRRLVPPTPRSQAAADQADDGPTISKRLPPWRAMGASLGLTALIVAAAVAAGWLIPEDNRDALIILVITSLSVAASAVGRIRSLPGTQDMGQFLLLVFCVAMGFTTDFGELFSSPTNVFGFTAVFLVVAVAIHFALAIALRIDRDTILITSVAAIFGPHMVGPAAVTLKNREVLFSGIASGLVGYALANYLGMTLAWMLS